jgi:hypothetical protein
MSGPAPTIAQLAMLDSSRVVGDRVRLLDPEVLVQPDQLCPQAVRHYTQGQCALFALALQEVVGGQIALVHAQGNIADWVHALVYTQGRLIDASGLASYWRLVRNWNQLSTQGPWVISRIGDERAARLLGSLAAAPAFEVQIARGYALQLAASLSLDPAE